jgi:hypothetical protein
MEGSAEFLVLAVGLSSQTGIIMSLLGATQYDENKSIDSSESKVTLSI